MARSTLLGTSVLALALALVAASPVHSETTWGVSLNIGNAPPPPVILVKQAPRTMVVPGTTVYVVSDDSYGHDCFRSGAHWYAWSNGYWYRASAWRGPFTVVETRSVPRAVLEIPAKHWKRHPHGGPPGLAKRDHGHKRDDVRLTSQPTTEVMVVTAKRGKKKQRKD